MNSVGDEPSGITGIKSGVRSQIGFWDSFYQKTTFNYWFETRYDRGWPRTDRVWPHWARLWLIWPLLERIKWPIKSHWEIYLGWISKIHTRVKIRKITFLMVSNLLMVFSLLIGWFLRFVLSSFILSLFPNFKKKVFYPRKNKFQKFSKISNFSKIKIRSNLLFLKWFCSILVR